ncbi:alpha/beta hydrolase fold domain-containing protein [Natronosalvus rutilus]|uniref:alpha/beta hydrolase fold domain-containing protein n=1 Tax=Natronosalvus rutilus TaxID=2953753 RepID=UPI0031BB824D
MKRFTEAYAPDQLDRRNAYAFPLQAHDLSGFPSATVLTAEFDPVRDEAFAFADRLTANIPVGHHHYDRMIHGFLSFPDAIDAA